MDRYKRDCYNQYQQDMELIRREDEAMNKQIDINASDLQDDANAENDDDGSPKIMDVEEFEEEAASKLIQPKKSSQSVAKIV